MEALLLAAVAVFSFIGSWALLWLRSSRRKKRAVNSGSAGGAGGYFYRCGYCKSQITGGSCAMCGPTAPVECVSVSAYGGSGGSSGGSGGGGGSTVFGSSGMSFGFSGGGGGGAASVAPSVDYDSCTNCGWRVMSKYNSVRPCPMCGSNAISYAVPQRLGPPPAPIGTTGMPGYSEKGTPEDWDLELGVVRGYRWFKIDIPESWAGVYRKKAGHDVNGKLVFERPQYRELEDSEIPYLYGAYGGKWDNGRMEATCNTSSGNPRGNHHLPPEVREPCGCGFWAYFDPNLPVSSVLTQWGTPRQRDGWTGIAVLGCIEGSGRVIIGEKGFRSQYAKIVAMAVGQCSVPGLMFWTDMNMQGPGMGPGGSYGAPNVQCSDSELLVRLSKIEDMLGARYPDARIMTSEDTLRKLFPPDKPSDWGGS